MPRKHNVAPMGSQSNSKHVIQAFLKVDMEWTSILLYDSKSQACKGLRRLQRSELERLQRSGFEPSLAHLLRVRRWDSEKVSTQVERFAVVVAQAA